MVSIIGTAESKNKLVPTESVSESEDKMLKKPLKDMDAEIEQAISNHIMPGAVMLIARNGKIIKQNAYGYSARYKDRHFTEMEFPIETQENTIYDLASISKLFTATAAMQLWDEGKFDLDDLISDYIPELAENGKEKITIRQLLTHTSGFRPDPEEALFNIAGSRNDRLQYVLTIPLKNEPGTHYEYSDINFLILGIFVERLSGEREDRYVHNHITRSLKMTDTMYNPPESLKERIAATEVATNGDRGLIWGDVHDPNAWALGGVAGHAGVFSTAADLSIFAQMMLNKGTYQGIQLLSEKAVQLMNKNWNNDFPDQDHGLGWELNQEWYMGHLADTNTMGHTGFTGTSMVISPNTNIVVILLTNHVHPAGGSGSTNEIRKKVADLTAASNYAWSASGIKDFVEKAERHGELTNEAGIHSLKLHLTAVKHYEDNNDTDKITKHTKNFQYLIKNQKNEQMMSDDVYQTLSKYADYLIGKRQNTSD